MKDVLIERLHFAWAEQNKLLDTFSDEEKEQTGNLEDWSIKDTIAHINAWKARLVVRLSAAVTGETPPAFEDTETLNEASYLECADRPWPAVLARAAELQAEIGRLLQHFTEDDLKDLKRYPWTNKRPLWVTVAGNAYSHPLSHLAEVYLARSELAEATRLSDAIAECGIALDSSKLWRSLMVYNLACFYSLSSQPEKALPRLAEALQLNPGLTDWSREDPDLVPLHGNPAYLALYSSCPRTTDCEGHQARSLPSFWRTADHRPPTASSRKRSAVRRLSVGPATTHRIIP